MKKTECNKKRTYGGVRASLREEERRSKLLAAGLEAFGTTGYAKSSIKGICSLAGLTERYFYESFASKEDLLSFVYNGVVDGLIAKARARLAESGQRPQEAVMAAVRVLFEAMLEDPRIARILYFEVLGVSPRIDQDYHAATRRLIDVIALVIVTAFPGVDREALDAGIVPTGLAGAVNLIALRWSLEGYHMSVEDILGQISLLLEGFGPVIGPLARKG